MHGHRVSGSPPVTAEYMKTDLEHAFDELLDEEDRQQRGYQFQRWLRDVLLRSGFEVHANPRTARPRQTDLYARRDTRDYLIEAKWQRSKIDIADIDALRSRIDRTPSDVIGCIFSLADYSESAIEAVTDRRDREILLFNAEEIQSLARSPALLPDLIDDKRENLRVHARVKFARREKDKIPSEIRLPTSDLRFWSGGSEVDSIRSGVENMDILFSLEHLDPIGNSDDAEFGLRLDLDARHLPELGRALGTLHNHLGLSGAGTFAIHQTEVSWHGAGAANFLTTAASWKARYDASDVESFHHSEELYYVDEFSYGQLLLTARQRVGESVFLHGAEVEIRIGGIPVDREPLRELCRKMGNRDAFLKLCQRKYFDAVGFRYERIPLVPVGTIRSSRFGNDVAVCGIIAKNPFFRKESVLKKAGIKLGAQVEHLRSVEFLCCALKDWHDVDDVADQYYLTDIQSKWLGPVLVVRPACTWKKLVAGPHADLRGGPTLGVSHGRTRTRSKRLRRSSGVR